MPVYLEVWGPSGPRLVPLATGGVTVGKAESNSISIAADNTMSRMHAAFERYPAGWCIRDLASSNGTFVNGERIWGERPLRSGDEITLGSTRFVFRLDEHDDGVTRTETAAPPPPLTGREKDVLIELCRPMHTAGVFTEPATIKHIAAALVVTEAAVKWHLGNLYAKFGLDEAGEGRRLRLANEAIRRGAVSVADLREDSQRA